MRAMSAHDLCPCGAGEYATCCQPYHLGQRWPETPVLLMRARYSAFALEQSDFVFKTWHPRTRPDDVTLRGVEWTGLEILATRGAAQGGPGDDAGVEFRAHFRVGDEQLVLHERSRFTKRAKRWFYLDGDVLEG